MRHQELVRQHAILKSLIKRTGHGPSTRDLEMLGHWGRYLCVLTSGFVENAVREILSQYTRASASPAVSRYAIRHIDDIRNPKAGRLVEIMSSFDSRWGRELEDFLQDNFRGDAVNSIMQNRHLIAHGRNSNITVGQVDQCLTRIVEIVDLLERQCGI